MAEQQKQNPAEINGANQDQTPADTGTQPVSTDSLSATPEVTTDTPICQSSSTNNQDNVRTSEMLSVDDSDDYLMNFEDYLTKDTIWDTSLIHSIIYRTPPASPDNTTQVQPTLVVDTNQVSNSSGISPSDEQIITQVIPPLNGYSINPISNANQVTTSSNIVTVNQNTIQVSPEMNTTIPSWCNSGVQQQPIYQLQPPQQQQLIYHYQQQQQQQQQQHIYNYQPQQQQPIYHYQPQQQQQFQQQYRHPCPQVNVAPQHQYRHLAGTTSQTYNRPEPSSRRRHRRRNRRGRTEAYRDHHKHGKHTDGRSSVSNRHVLDPVTPPLVTDDRSRPSLPLIHTDVPVSRDPVRIRTVRTHTHIYIYIYVFKGM